MIANGSCLEDIVMCAFVSLDSLVEETKGGFIPDNGSECEQKILWWPKVMARPQFPHCLGYSVTGCDILT